MTPTVAVLIVGIPIACSVLLHAVTVSRGVQALNKLVEVCVKTEIDLKNMLDEIRSTALAVADRFKAQAGTIAQLREQVASGTPVTADQLNDLVTEAASIRDTLQALAGEPPAAPAAPVAAAPAETVGSDAIATALTDSVPATGATTLPGDPANADPGDPAGH